jgi:hypothetical protein
MKDQAVEGDLERILSHLARIDTELRSIEGKLRTQRRNLERHEGVQESVWQEQGPLDFHLASLSRLSLGLPERGELAIAEATVLGISQIIEILEKRRDDLHLQRQRGLKAVFFTLKEARESYLPLPDLIRFHLLSQLQSKLAQSKLRPVEIDLEFKEYAAEVLGQIDIDLSLLGGRLSGGDRDLLTRWQILPLEIEKLRSRIEAEKKRLQTLKPRLEKERARLAQLTYLSAEEQARKSRWGNCLRKVGCFASFVALLAVLCWIAQIFDQAQSTLAVLRVGKYAMASISAVLYLVVLVSKLGGSNIAKHVGAGNRRVARLEKEAATIIADQESMGAEERRLGEMERDLVAIRKSNPSLENWRGLTIAQRKLEVKRQIKILFLSATPAKSSDSEPMEESRAIAIALRSGVYRDSFDLEQCGEVRAGDLQELLLLHRPDIVHFSGHGNSANQIVLVDEQGQADPVPAPALGELFSLLKGHIRCVVLNCCYSQPQAAAIGDHIECVIGMREAISNVAATIFARAFYQALAYGENTIIAHALACNQLDLLEEHRGRSMPEVILRPGQTGNVTFVGAAGRE